MNTKGYKYTICLQKFGLRPAGERRSDFLKTDWELWAAGRKDKIIIFVSLKHTYEITIGSSALYYSIPSICTKEESESWFSRLQDTHRYWAANGLTGKLRYTGKEYLNTYLWNEKYAVQTFMKPVFFTAGDKSVKFQPNDLTRIDGRWKAFKLPTRINI